MNLITLFKMFDLSLLQVLKGLFYREREGRKHGLVDSAVVSADLNHYESDKAQENHPCFACV
jgi:hypothetical protein